MENQQALVHKQCSSNSSVQLHRSSLSGPLTLDPTFLLCVIRSTRIQVMETRKLRLQGALGWSLIIYSLGTVVFVQAQDSKSKWQEVTGGCDPNYDKNEALSTTFVKAIEDCIQNAESCCFDEVRKNVTVGFFAGAVWFNDKNGSKSLGLRFYRGRTNLFAHAVVPQDFSRCPHGRTMVGTPDCLVHTLDMDGSIADKLKRRAGLAKGTPTPLPKPKPNRHDSNSGGASTWAVVIAAVIGSATTGLFLFVSTLVSRRQGWLCFSSSKEGSKVPNEVDNSVLDIIDTSV